MSLKYSFLTNLFILLTLYHSSLCDNECIYKESRYQEGTNKTDANYLKNLNSEDSKKQKCFGLSDSNVFNQKCCYDTQNKLCTSLNSGSNIECPKDTEIVNNCGMAGFYQPITSERCTEISLVDGFCCYIKTKSKGTACIKKKEINEDKDKTVLSDDMKEYLQGLSPAVDVSEVESVKCGGSFMKKNYSVRSLLILAIIALI